MCLLYIVETKMAVVLQMCSQFPKKNIGRDFKFFHNEILLEGSWLKVFVVWYLDIKDIATALRYQLQENH